MYDPTVVWLPKHWTLDSLKLAATAMDYGESIVMTLVTVIPSVLLQLITVRWRAMDSPGFILGDAASCSDC